MSYIILAIVSCMLGSCVSWFFTRNITVNHMNEQFNAYLMEVAKQNAMKTYNVRKRILGFNSISEPEIIQTVAKNDRIIIKGFRN